MRKCLLFYALFLLPFLLTAQSKWDLRSCVEYAMKNNISVRQSDVQARIADLQLKQAKYYQYPTLNFSTNTGVRFGRSIDPTTNQFSNTQFLYQNFGVNGGIQVYNFGRLKNNVSAMQFSAQAALADVEKAANDIALNVATYYLQVLSSHEQIEIDSIQIEQTRAQYENTKSKVEAGLLPELNLAELEAQLAIDSTNLITAQQNYQQNLLALKGLLSLDAATPFEVEMPPIEEIPIENLADMQPENVYASASVNFPQQKANIFRLKSASATVKSNKSALFPSLGLGYDLSTNFSNSFKKISGYKIDGYQSVTGFEPVVQIGSDKYYVQQPLYTAEQTNRSFGNLWEGWGDQINNNFGQNVGIQLSIPIFNNGTARINYKRSKLDLQNYQLQKEQADLQLKQDIYNAYINAESSMKKYFVGFKSVESAQKAYDYAVKRYNVGLISTIDLITNQNKLLTAKLQQLTNHIDYVFRMKLLEFYKGQGLKL